MPLRTWAARAAAPLRFTPIPVSILTVIVYAAVFVWVLVTDELPSVPENTRGLDLDRAYKDLQAITVAPHPYVSHANDEVYSYLVSRVEPVASKYDYVHLSIDLQTNASFFNARGHGTYFEGTNILVKIDGTDTSTSDSDEKPDGVLFSAHFDSVSTAPGATDDGMGVVTILAMIEYLATPEHRPRRTAIFFLNNGEEDGLNGAHTYYEHPWSNLTGTFINLEGAASGGRPLVFRSTSLGAARAFAARAVSHPHGNVLSADAFARGVIKSATDYEVYAKGIKGQTEGMSGSDFAFYRNRAYYHTPLDSIAGMGPRNARKALWAMMDGVRGAGLALLNEDVAAEDDQRHGVYFDLFGHAFVAFPLQALFVTNVVLLVVGPISVIGLLVWVILVARKQDEGTAVNDSVSGAKWKKILKYVFDWGRFCIMFIVGAAAEVALVVGYVKLNPYIIHSHAKTVLLAVMSLSYLSVTVPLQAIHAMLPSPSAWEKLTVTAQLYLLTWILLVASTTMIRRLTLGGLYWVTVWNLCAWLVSCLSLAESVWREKRGYDRNRKVQLDVESNDDNDDTVPARRYVAGMLHEYPETNGEGQDAQDGEAEAEIVETEPTEITPLMHQHHRVSDSGREYVTVDAGLGDAHTEPDSEEYGWWIVQLLLLVPIPAVLLFQIELILLGALNNTLVDGSSPVVAYAGLAALSFMIFLPLAPFAHRLHVWLTMVVVVVLAVSLAFTWVAFPFTYERPFKVFFQQSVELQLPANTSVDHIAFSSPSIPLVGPRGGVVRAVTSLTGLQGYVDRLVIPEMPSSTGKDVQCSEDRYLRPGLLTCRWESELLPSPDGTGSVEDDLDSILAPPRAMYGTDWVDVTTERLNTSSAMLSIRGTNTRGCRLYFDTPIHSYRVYYPASGSTRESRSEMQLGFEMPPEGVKEVRLWSRTWDREFVVEVGWEDKGEAFTMHGNASCIWAEYASGSAGSNNASASARIPAFEEVKKFLPLWAAPTKVADGLVEAWAHFSV
ncbi:Zn-dependent exopeptidase [Obba rivulosa]|uniref:Peptide hydrolase n=1 Tax=Obba rivulosa TaxID=1052685 RepID=A0A8E2DJV2_9APHY|nr:Zn-dependent exopeptidase [Obba rivulosa]